LRKIATEGNLGERKVLKEANRLRSGLRELSEKVDIEQAEKVLSYAKERIAEQKKKAREEK
jgi:hypothetical protein